jgi:hypothetical protein
MLNSKSARAFAVLAALAAVGCGQARQDISGESVAGRSAFETVAAGNFIPGTMACPTFACLVGALLYADFPLRFEEALGATFEASDWGGEPDRAGLARSDLLKVRLEHSTCSG